MVNSHYKNPLLLAAMGLIGASWFSGLSGAFTVLMLKVLPVANLK